MPTVVTKTVKPQGGGNYSSLAAFMAGEQRNILGLDQIARAECYAGLDTAPVSVSGWGATAERHVLVEPAEGHGHAGVWTNAGYRLVTSGDETISVGGGQHLRLHGLQMRSTAGGDLTAVISAGSGTLSVERCILDRGDHVAGCGIYVEPYGVTTNTFINNVIYGARQGIRWWLEDNSVSATVVNNTIVRTSAGTGAWAGIMAVSDGVGDVRLQLHNNLVVSYPTGYSLAGASLTSSANVSTQGGSPNGAPWNNRVVQFVDAANRNYGLAASDTGAKDQGTDRSALIGTSSINGASRPQGAAWDVGAFELVSVVVKTTGATASGSSAATARAVRIGQTGATTAGTSAATARAIRMQPVGGAAAGTSAASITRTIRIQQTGAEAHGTSYAYATAQRQAEERPTGAIAHGTSSASIGAVVIIQHKPTGATAAGTSSASIERTIRIQEVGATAAGTSEATARGMLLKLAGGVAAGTSLAEILGTTIVLGQRIVLRGSGPTARLVVYGGGRAEEIGAEGLVVPGSDGASYRLYVSEAGEPLLEAV